MGSNWKIIRDVDQKEVGYIRLTFQGRTFSGQCKMHGGKCKLLANIDGDHARTESWVAQWILAGLSSTADQHKAMHTSLKAGMARVRSTG